MQYQDFRSLAESRVSTDLCIVGTGPAGLSIAQEFIGSGCRVLLIESGDRRETAESCALNAVQSIGSPRQVDQALVRTRIFGGTSHVWSGRCTTLDPLDFEPRAWVPLSGWPFGAEALADYLGRAADNLGLCRMAYDDALDARLERYADRLPDPELLRHCIWQFSVDDSDASTPWRFARSFSQQRAANVRVLLNATATQVVPDRYGKRVEALEISSLNGKKATVHARVFVLCAGGVETPRLLLASTRVQRHGVGNQHGVVGRYLMDHPRCTLGQFDLNESARLRSHFALQRLEVDGRGRYFQRGVSPSSALQRREQLLNCAAWLRERHATDDPWDAMKRAMRRIAPGPQKRRVLEDLRSIVSQPVLTTRQIRRKYLERKPVIHKVDRLDLLCDVEQVPNPDSRLTLADEKDALGVPLARIDWRIGEHEKRTLQRFGRAVIAAFERMGLPAPRLETNVRSGCFEPADFIDVAHPSGTVRMSDDPKTGVVDANCRVHGMAGLYVVGNAVFPTNGHANPTLTIVALALRVADWIKASEFDNLAERSPRALPQPAARAS